MAVNGRAITDAQAHLWKAEIPDWPWVPGRKPQLPEPFTIEKLVALMDEAGVDRVVIVPPSWPGDRNDYALEAAKRYPNRFAVMGRIPICRSRTVGGAASEVEGAARHGRRAADLPGREQARSSTGHADWFWPAAEKAGLPVMFFAPGQHPEVRARSRSAIRGSPLIIDHMGLNPDIGKEGRIARARSTRWSRSQNIRTSRSRCRRRRTSPGALPVARHDDAIKRCFDAFGPRRCYWGTDLTNSLAKATYRQRITQFTEELPFLSEQDKDWVMGKAILARLKWA